MRVCLLSNFVVFAVLAARELATRTVVFHYIPCVCVCVCVLQLRFHPGSQRPGRQEALVFVCVTCVCLLSNFVLFAVLAARELAARTQWSSIIKIPCACSSCVFILAASDLAAKKRWCLCVCHVCLSAFQFCPVCSPGRQRAGRQDAVVFHNIARLCSSCVFILAASRLAARKWGSSNCAFHVAPIPFDHPGLQ